MMEAVCPGEDSACQTHAMSAALHALNLYCAAVSAALICWCAPRHTSRLNVKWRGQNLRGVASGGILVTWVYGAGAASLRPDAIVALVAAALLPLAWLAASVLHVALWTRRSAAPLLYLAIYWLLTAASSATLVWQSFVTGATWKHVEIYIHTASVLFSLIIFGVDGVCFYDEVTKRSKTNNKNSNSEDKPIFYKHNETNFFSRIAFFWLNSLLYKGYKSPLDDFGELPIEEQPEKYYRKFKKIFNNLHISNCENINLFGCYVRMVWPNFYVAGVMKLLSDLIGVVPPLGLAVIIQFIDSPHAINDQNSKVTLTEFINNGYVMLLIVTVALIGQALLSQNSTHVVSVEGTRMKIALQCLIYDKCMRIAPWASRQPGRNLEEESPLINNTDETTSKSGLLTNLVSQDTYNIMSCVWVCHYIWAIPLKVSVILYLLYTKLGISAIIGSATSMLLITPLQFYIGKKISENSKDISKRTDNRISKMNEILQGINVIKLYVWEDLFNEKILNLREVELKLLNKDSIYWSILTFTTQVSTLLVTLVTFTIFYYVEGERGLLASNVFTGLALFNQLSIPLLILPVTVMMVIQAMVSTRRIKEYLELPESNNVPERENNIINNGQNTSSEFIQSDIEAIAPNIDTYDHIIENNEDEGESECDQFSDDDVSPLVDDKQDYLVRFRNAAFSWGIQNDAVLEIDDLDIPVGKLVMIVGATGSGKTSLLSAVLGEMFPERGEVHWNGSHSTWFAGQPPWLLEGSVRDNIVMDNAWCQRKYARVLRATALHPDLLLLPEGDATLLGSHGTPLSGGQRVRVSVARALYSDAHLLALDEPLGALDAGVARHLVAQGVLPAARGGRTILLATNRLELLHYADLVITMEDGRVSGCGRIGPGGGADGCGESTLSRWAQLASAARAGAARGSAGPPGGSARERARLVRALSRNKFQRCASDESILGINEATGAHLLSEVPTCAGGSWRRRAARQRPALERQYSSPAPPTSMHNIKFRGDIRRAVSVDASSMSLQREASLLRRLLRTTRRLRGGTLARFTPRTVRRLISSDSETPTEGNQSNEKSEDPTFNSTRISMASNGTDVATANAQIPQLKDSKTVSEFSVWWEYARACGWWGVAFWLSAAVSQGLALAADCWLMHFTAQEAKQALTDEQKWDSICVYASWCVCGALASGAAGASSAAGGAAARRRLHERLLRAALHTPLHHHHDTPRGHTLYRFSADILVIDKKLPTSVSRWAQLALLCGAAVLINAVMTPWSMVALLPAVLFYLGLQSIYLCNARELQREEARSAASVVSLATETSAGAGTVRAGRLQRRMRRAFLLRLAANHNVLLLLNAANRWLGLTLDLVGAGSVSASVMVALWSGKGEGAGAGAGAGLAGAYSLLLPAYLAHLAKCRADLDLHLAAVQRLCLDTRVPHENYREDCTIPPDWPRNGKIEFENVSIQAEPGSQTILKNINLTVSPGEKVAICGRSGSGKTSLLLSCVGATSVASGRLVVDGADSAAVPLRALRRRLVLVPQEAALFAGTLRENLDPLAVHTDQQIWDSLRAVGLHEFVAARSAGLECTVCAGGGWSEGRVSRVCCARAVLHAPAAAALLLDEPAAALDAPAERALLHSLAAAAPNTTIITVAHRISSVVWYDRAVVLEQGGVAELGAPAALLARPASRLARMVAAAHKPIRHVSPHLT